ncbi:MAG: hypothetical protein KDI75_03325 [Xanthomonadales bacterium]|nr:hypothetical protein [Xanthomonadales bacterium]
MRHLRFVLVLGPALLLSACGGGKEDVATTACTSQISDKLKDQNYRIDPDELLASAKAEDDAIMRLTGTVVFDPGLPREYKQQVDCRVRFVSGQELPNVISLNFTWE